MKQYHMKQYYVYLLIDSSSGVPFYVGKGTGNRMFGHERDAMNESYQHRSVHAKIRALKAAGVDIAYKQIQCSSEDEAFVLEQQLICEIGRRDLGLGPLRNLTDGGEGVRNQTTETIEKRAAWHRGRKRSPEALQRMSEVQLARKLAGHVTSSDTKEKQRAALASKNLQTDAVKRKRVENTTKRVQMWSMDGTQLLATFDSADIAAKAVGLKRGGGIKSCCVQLLDHAGGYKWKYEQYTISPVLLRPVHQIDPLTENVVQTWHHLKDAAKHVGVSIQQVLNCIRGRHHTAGTFVWAFADDGPQRTPRQRPVDQYALDGTTLMHRWPSATEAGRQLKLNYTGILRCCAGRLHTSQGFIWKYADT